MGNKGLKHAFPGIITGASTGIGRGLAIKLAADHKARLVINARSQDSLEETKKAVESKGGQAFAVVGDIADPEVRHRMVETCLTEFGGIDLLVNNAGLAKPGLVTNLSTDDWRHVFEVNFFACLDSVYRVLPQFLKQGYGKIVNISSVAGKVAFAGSVCYASSKFALTAMSNGMAAEFAHNNIDVLTVCPGWVRTEFFEKNAVADIKNPTLIAQQNDLRGWLMKNVLSISTEQAVDDIEVALNKGGSHEIIMTAPGKFIERLQGLTPNLLHAVNRRLPLDALDSSRTENRVKEEPSINQ
ncbi:SDR family oxidoreductase [Candidatus Obscuribacterales bacterium]|nr:SDR family oxidoreductase [Candidatus Obscuribacterales bacterium]